MIDKRKRRAAARGAVSVDVTDTGTRIRLYGVVGDPWDGFDADSVYDALEQAEGDITIRLNSPGGIIYEGMAMHSTIVEKNATVIVDGLAASAATLITCAARRVLISRGAMMMIHEPWGFAMGEEKDMQKSAEVLAKWRESMVHVYQAKTGLDRDFIEEMMAEETWLTAEEAVEFGFADGLAQDEKPDSGDDQSAAKLAAVPGIEMLKDCKNLPDRVAAAIAGQDRAAVASAQKPVNQQNVEETMERIKTAGSVAHKTENQIDLDKARAEAVEAERERVKTIKGLGEGLPAELVASLIDDGLNVEEAQAAIDRVRPYLEKPEENDVHSHHRIEITRDAEDTRRESVQNALLNRFRPGQYKIAADSPAREYANMSLMELATESLERAGKNARQMNRHARAQGALSTSDFPAILSNVAGKVLADSYELAPRTFLDLGVRQTLSDFKEVTYAGLGQASRLEKVGEGGEYTYGELNERGEQYRLYKYGRIVPITWEAIVNDDLDAFTRIPARLAAAAAQKESDLFWAVVTGNPKLATTGEDLFSADHGNYNSTDEDISVATIGAARAALRGMKDGGHYLRSEARYLVVPTALETTAEQFVSNNLLAHKPGEINPFAGRLQVISEPRLDDATDKAWYLWADPAAVDTIAYAYLQGEEGPQLFTEQGFDVDGLKLKVRHVFAAAPLDYRGIYRQDTDLS